MTRVPVCVRACLCVCLSVRPSAPPAAPRVRPAPRSSAPPLPASAFILSHPRPRRQRHKQPCRAPGVDLFLIFTYIYIYLIFMTFRMFSPWIQGCPPRPQHHGSREGDRAWGLLEAREENTALSCSCLAAASPGSAGWFPRDLCGGSSGPDAVSNPISHNFSNYLVTKGAAGCCPRPAGAE